MTDLADDAASLDLQVGDLLGRSTENIMGFYKVDNVAFSYTLLYDFSTGQQYTET